MQVVHSTTMEIGTKVFEKYDAKALLSQFLKHLKMFHYTSNQLQTQVWKNKFERQSTFKERQ